MEVVDGCSPVLERKHSLTGEDTDLELFDQFKSEALLPLKEDLADWLNKTLGKPKICLLLGILLYEMG